MRTTTSASNLIGGVSQQPAVLRLPNQAEEQINFYPSPIQGLTRRNPLEHVDFLSLDSSPAFYHWINRDSQERYLCVLQEGVSTPEIRVFDLAGTEYPVFADSYAYLVPNGVPFSPELYRAVTVADYTFLVNRSRTVQMDNSVLDDVDNVAGRGYVQIVQGNYSSKYQITVGYETGPNKAEIFTIHTWNGDDQDTANDAVQSRWQVWFGATFSGGFWTIGTPGQNWTLDYNKNLSGGSPVADSTTVQAPAALAGTGSVTFDGAALETWITDFVSQFVDDIAGNGSLKVANFKIHGSTVYFEILGNQTGTFNVSPSFSAIAAGGNWSLTELASVNDAKFTSIGTSDLANEFAKKINASANLIAKSFGSTIQITSKVYPLDRLDVEDSFGDGGMRAVNRKAQTFADLPTIAKQGYGVLVEGNAGAEEDDYWVRFKANDTGTSVTGSQGVWEEGTPLYPSTAFGVLSRAFLPLNMPHTLVRKQDDGAGTVTGIPDQVYFEFANGEWEQRDVGDPTTNPNPSFVGQKLEDLFFYKNRLGFISGDRVIMSEAGRYFNFWRTTVRSLLDSAPIDVTASHVKAVTLKHAVPSQDNLVLFSDRAQLALSSDRLLSPKTVAIDPVSDFEVALTVRPVNLETSILFARKRGQYSSLVQFYRQDEVSYNGQELTQAVPSYILGDVSALAFCESEKVIAVVTSSGGALYLFNYAISGGQYVQQAWHKFIPSSGQIRAAQFYEDTLYLVLERVEGLFLEKLSFSTSARDDDSTFQVRIDRRIKDTDLLSAIYDEDSKTTTLELPYDLEGVPVVATRADGDGSGGVSVAVASSPDPSHVVLAGDWTDRSLWIGESYESRLTFSTITLKKAGQQGMELVIGEHIQLLNGKLVFEKSGFFRTTVTPFLRDPVHQDFTGPGLSTLQSQVEESLLEDGVFKFSIMGKNQDTTIEVSSSSPLPCSLLTAEWTLNYHSR